MVFMDLQVGEPPGFLRPYSLLCVIWMRDAHGFLRLIESILFGVNNANEPYVCVLEPPLPSVIQTVLLRSATYTLHLLWIVDFCSNSCDVSYISDLFSSLPCHKNSGILFQWGLTSPSVRILFPLFALQGYYIKEDFIHNKGLCVLSCYIQHSTSKSIPAPWIYLNIYILFHLTVYVAI